MPERDRISCDYATDCPLAKVNGGRGCKEDIHHRYWPRRRYVNKLEKTFRQLLPNTVKICRRLHEEIHATESPPDKPDHEFMSRAIGLATRTRRNLKKQMVEQRRSEIRIQLRGYSAIELDALLDNWEESQGDLSLLIETAKEVRAERRQADEI